MPIRYAGSDVLHTPHSPSSRPDVSLFYDKDIIAFVPHLQFPDLIIPCKGKECSGHFRPDGFPSTKGDSSFYRRVYGTECSLYFIHYNYKCTICDIKKSSAVLLEECQAEIENPRIPLFIQNQIGIHFMSRSAVTYTLRDYILNSSMTASSFHQTREVIHSSYLSRYLRMKAHYQSILDRYRLHVKKSIKQSFCNT